MGISYRIKMVHAHEIPFRNGIIHVRVYEKLINRIKTRIIVKKLVTDLNNHTVGISTVKTIKKFYY